MKKIFYVILFQSVIVLFALSFSKCGGGGGENRDADVEIDGEIPGEVEIETQPDPLPEMDVSLEQDLIEEDLTEEVQQTELETIEDINETQELEEVEEDTLGECDTIAIVRETPDGSVDLTLCHVFVTYIGHNGYFLQVDTSGPAIQVYEGNTWTPDVSVGDEITMHITSLTTFHGNKEINAHDPVIIHSSGNDVSTLIQDLSSGILPSEDLEAELIRVTGAEVTSISGPDLLISYGIATDVNMRVADSGIFCIGATFSVVAVVTEWSDSGIWRIQSFGNTDFYDLDTSACGGGGRAPQPGELLINEFMASVPLGINGDANCDGTRTANQEEFIEIVNISSDTLDLSGVSISDNTRPRHTFSPGTTLAPMKAIVVFGGGTPSCTSWGTETQVVTASDGTLSLDDTGDTITITDSSGTILLQVSYPATTNRQSYTLNPDLNDTDPSLTQVGGYVDHSVADTIDHSLFSPGTHIDGTLF